MVIEELIREIEYKTARSGGAGGQHVNKVESKVILVWNLGSSTALSENEKSLIRLRLAGRLSKNNDLQFEESNSRSQFSNKATVTARFIQLMRTALIPQKKRLPTKTPKYKIRERLDRKKRQSQKKRDRRQHWE